MAPAPKAVNWVEKGAVTPIKDQGDCGSCWAYSAVSEIESSVFMATGKLPVLSTQQLVSCDKGDNGCNGGNPSPAYDYVRKAGGLDTAADYPDTSSDNGTVKKCSWNKKVAAKIKGYKCPIPECVLDCNHQDENKLALALANMGPFSICVFAEDAWFTYKKGIYSTKTCDSDFSKMDHAIQLVGYNRTGPVPYWIIRNQWGTDWGYGGYIHVKMGENMCGLANQPTMAIIDTANTDIIV